MPKIQAQTKGASGSGGYATVQDEGVALTQRTTINFTGAGVTASDSGGVTVVNIPGGGGGATWAETEIDFGTKPVPDAQFTITDASVSGTSKILCVSSGNTATGRVAGDTQWDAVTYSAIAGTGSFTLYAVCPTGSVVGKRKVYYSVA